MKDLYENEEQESTIDSFLDAVRRQNLAQSRSHFDNLMNQKLGDALDQEKSAIASTLYSFPEEEEEVEAEFEGEEFEEDEGEEVFSDDEELEDEIDQAIEEDDEEEAAP